MNPRASDNKPINRRTKRIMTFYAWRNLHRPSIDYPARPVRSIESDDPPLGMRAAAASMRGAGGAGRQKPGACLERWAGDPLPWALRQSAKGYIRGGDVFEKRWPRRTTDISRPGSAAVP